MAADKLDAQLKQKLDKRLVRLQGESAAVQTLVSQTNQREYQNLSAIYVWWRAAATIDGYLDEVLKPTFSRRVYNHANDGTSFRRLLYLMYGNYGLDKHDLERKNAVLCGLHNEYEKNQQLYAKDSVNKLAGYVKSQGGAHGIINLHSQSLKESPQTPLTQTRLGVPTSKTKLATPSVQVQATLTSNATRNYQSYKPRIEVNITDGMRQSALLNEAEAYFAKQSSTQQIKITPPIVTNSDGYGLALVKRNNAVYDLIGATDSIQSIRELIVTAYRKQYAALPLSMRCFFEIIKTQSLPSNLQKLYDRLGELSVEKHEDNTKKKIQRRVIYVASDNMLVLSPTYSKSGVVTLAKLKANPFENGAVDCFMPTRCRKVIEQRMVSNNDFNLFAPSNSSVVPRFKAEGLASHMLRLDNKADKGDFVFIEFWNFEEEIGTANEQLFFASSYKASCSIKLSVTKSDMQTLAYDQINKWLDSYGEHILRPANQLIEIEISQNGFELGFDFVNGVFRNHAISLFASKYPQPISYKATFLARDICLALHGVGSLHLTSDIEVVCSVDVLILSFSTDVADYTIAVPTTNGTRHNENAFCTYKAVVPTTVLDSYSDDSSIEDALLFEATLAKSNAVLSDSEIEKMLGYQADDYQELLEAWLPQTYESYDDVEWNDISSQQ